MNNLLFKAALTAGAAICIGAPASAAVLLTTTGATPVYSGPPVTFDFESTNPAYPDANIVVGSDGTRAQPVGSTGQYFSVGPAEGTPAIISLAGFNSIESLSFLWGSVDSYNLLEVIDGSNNVLESFTGAAALGAGGTFGNQTSPLSNRLATLTFTGTDRQLASALRFTSTSNAFEIDNIAVGVVPEPATWAMMIGGFALVGGMMRRTRRVGSRHAALA